MTRGIVLTSNDEPSYEPFISRLIYLVKDDIQKTERETQAFLALDDYLKQGLACISVELLQYRKLIAENYKNSFETLEKYIKKASMNPDLGLSDVETRNYSKTTQTLVIGFILTKFEKISFNFAKRETEQSLEEYQKDILIQFGTLGLNQLIFQHRMSMKKTALHQFFEVFQSMYDTKRVYEGSHFRIDNGMFTVNLSSFYPIYQKEFFIINRENPQSKDEIFDALRNLDENHVVKKSVRFANIEEGIMNKGVVANNCISVTYSILQTKFGLDIDTNNPFAPPPF